MKFKINIFTLMLALAIFAGCGVEAEIGDNSKRTVTGQFIDDKIKGLEYRCSSGVSGSTDVNGEYTCKIGDDVTFSIESRFIATIAAQKEVVTPYSLFPNNITAAINLARLLQSLGDDSNTIEGVIEIKQSLAALLPSTLDCESASFISDVETNLGMTLVNAIDAQSNMNSAITEAGGSIPGAGNIPVANSGADQNVNTTSIVTLDGSGSSDANFDSLTYSWSITSKPAGSSATLSNIAVVNPTFEADVDGSYVLQLIVNDGTLNSAADTVTITATTANAVPVANSGPDQNVNTTSIVTLDGSGSSDANFDSLTYSWSITSKPAGSSATLSNIAVVNPTFEADVDGSYVLQLIVNDGTLNSAADTVTITATTAKQKKSLVYSHKKSYNHCEIYFLA